MKMNKKYCNKNNIGKWGTLLIISSANMALNINMYGFRAILPLINVEFAFTRAMAGLYTTLFFMSGTILALFSGRLADILGAKKGMLIGIFYMGFFMVLHVFAPSFTFLLAIGLLTGVGFSIITPSCTKAVKMLVPPSRLGFSMGMMQSSGAMGSILGATLLPWIGVFFGWRFAIFFSGIYAIFMGFLLLKYYEDGENTKKDKYGNEKENDIHFNEAIVVLLKNKYLLSLCFIGIFLGVCNGAFFSHFSLFLAQDLGFSKTIAGMGLIPFVLGGVTGRLILGYWSDKLAVGDKRIIYLFIGVLVVISSLFFSFAASRGNISFYLMITMAFLLGAGGEGWEGVYFTNVVEVAGDSYTGIATGLSLIFLRIGMLISPPIFGYIADLNDSYQNSWFYTAILFAAAVLIFYWVTGRVNKNST
jgi:predicted MFS family arabinose efflux permease